MKVTFKNMLLADSGKCDGIVYYFNARLGRVIARKIPSNLRSLALCSIFPLLLTSDLAVAKSALDLMLTSRW
jgi:hypothetical protein